MGTKARVLVNNSGNTQMVHSGTAEAVLYPFDRVGRTALQNLFVIIDASENPKIRAELDHAISRKFLRVAGYSTAIGLPKCQVGLLEDGKITAMSSDPVAVCGIMTEVELRKVVPALFEGEPAPKAAELKTKSVSESVKDEDGAGTSRPSRAQSLKAGTGA